MNLKNISMKKSVLALLALVLLLSATVLSATTAHAADGWPQSAVEMRLGTEVIDSMKETDYHGAIEGVGGNNLYYWKVYEFSMEEDGLLDIYLESEDASYLSTAAEYDGFAIFDGEEPDNLVWRSCKKNYRMQKKYSSAQEMYYGSVKVSLKEGDYYFAIRQQKAGGGLYYLTLSYEKPVVNVTSVSLSRKKTTIKDDGKRTLKATILPSNATNQAIEWSSSEPSVATVSTRGVVQGVAPGTTTITATSEDGEISAECEVTVTCNHKYRTTITPASAKKDGRKQVKCSKCKDKTTTKIYAAGDISLSKTSYVRDGKKHKPSVVVRDSNGKKLKASKSYTVTYPKGTENVGRYTVVIKFKGNYTGTVKKSFTVFPKATSIKQVKPKKQGFALTWKKQKVQSTGYEIAYSTDSNFSKTSTVKVLVDKNTKVSGKVSKLEKGKIYYVKIRVYTNTVVNGKTKALYSEWSDIKAVVTL